MNRALFLSPLLALQPAAWADVEMIPLPSRIEVSPAATATPALRAEPTPDKPTSAPARAAPQAPQKSPPASSPSATPKTPRRTAASAPAPAQGTITGDTLAARQASGDESLKRYDRTQNEIARALNEGRKADALNLMKSVWDDAVRMEDIGTMGAMAYLAMDLKEEETSIKAARTAAELVDDDEYYAIWGNVLIKFNRLDQVDAVLKKMDPKSDETRQLLSNYAINKARAASEQGRHAEAEQILLGLGKNLDINGVEMLGWAQYHLGKYEDAARQFGAAYKKTPRESNAQGLFFSLHKLKRYSDLVSASDATPGPLNAMLSPEIRAAIQAGSTQFTVDGKGHLAIAPAQAGGPEPGISVKLEGMTREKSGERGEGRLSQRGSLLTGIWQGEQDQFSLRLSAIDTDDHAERVEADKALGAYALWLHHSESGFVYRLGAGKTQAGGVLEPAWIGEAGISYYTPDFGLGILAFRRANESSLLSISGKTDPLTGLRWGRVLESGATLSANLQYEGWSSLASLTAAELSGENVADNHKLEFYGRALHPIDALPGLSLGPEIYATRYDRNLSAFEPGHGGYFSPRGYLQLGAIANYETRLGDVDLSLLAGLGWNWNRQDAADGNPLTGEEPGKYAASDDQGVVYHARLEGSVPLDRQWRVGFSLGGQKTPDYTDWRIGIFAQGQWQP